MYKVFYNEKLILLSEKPVVSVKSLKFNTESQFEEALAFLRTNSAKTINIYYHHLEKLWEIFKNHFDYLEAAGGMVRNTDNEILFIHRLGKWDLPKGKVEAGETTELAAVREVSEECGINNLIIKRLIIKTHHIYFQRNLKLKTTFWYEMDYSGNEKLIPQTEEGIGIAAWKKKSEFPEIFENTYGNIKLVLEKFI